MAKLLAADASVEAGNVCIQTHGGFGFAEEYDVERKFRETRLYQVAPISTNLILSFLAEHVLGMPGAIDMRRAAIVAPLRTPVGAFGGSLRDVPVETLGSLVAKAVINKSGIDPALIEDVVFAQSYANSETPCVGRWIALSAGMPIEVPGMQLDRRCGGGLQWIDGYRGHDGRKRRVRRGDGRRCRKHEPHRILFDRHALGKKVGNDTIL